MCCRLNVGGGSPSFTPDQLHVVANTLMNRLMKIMHTAVRLIILGKVYLVSDPGHYCN